MTEPGHAVAAKQDDDGSVLINTALIDLIIASFEREGVRVFPNTNQRNAIRFRPMSNKGKPVFTRGVISWKRHDKDVRLFTFKFSNDEDGSGSQCSVFVQDTMCDKDIVQLLSPLFRRCTMT